MRDGADVTSQPKRIRLGAAPRSSASSPRLLGAALPSIQYKNREDATLSVGGGEKRVW
jgi:hypothetical protein